MERLMKIIDAHHHLWAPQTPSLDIGYGWLKDIGAMKPFGDPTAIQRDYLLDEYLGESGARTLSGSVHVQADPKLPDPVAETAFIQKLSHDSGHPIMIVGFADLASDTFADQIKRHLAFPNLRGIRQIISHLPDRPELSFAATQLLENPTWRANYATLADNALRFDLQLYPEQMAQAAEIVADHPGIPVVVDHLGSPYDSSQEGRRRWRDGMRALAAVPHVSVKLSGYAMFFGADLEGVAQQVTVDILEMFGPDRVMFASNFPVDKLHLTYAQVLDHVIAAAGPDAASKVMYHNAFRFYGF